MIKLSKKQLSMSLFVLALNTLPLNSFASGQFSEESEGELGNSSSAIINTETRTINFRDIFENNLNVGNNDIIDIADVDILDETKFNYLNTILEGGNNLVNLIITSNTRFLNDGVLSMNWDALPENLKHLSIKDKYGLVKKTGERFLCCDSLITFDSRGLENVTQIGERFLTECENLISINLLGFKNVKQIKGYFLSACENLISIDLLAFKNVKQIGKEFLSDCENLIFFDSRGLENVKQIGAFFLSSCKKLTTIDLRGLKNMTETGDYFLYNCKPKEIITTSTNLLLLKKALSEEIKDLIKEKKTVFLIQNEDKYKDIEERVEYVQENYTQEMSGLIKHNDKGHIQIEIKKGLSPLLM